MGFAETAPLVAQLDLKGNFVGNLRKAQGALGQFSGSLGRAGKGVGQIGAGFARVGALLGTVVAGGIVGAAKAAIDFEDAFAGVRKTVDEADLTKAGLSFEILAKQFRGMATEIPIAATEFARLGETAGALGVKAGDIQEFVRVTALMGVTTNLSADAAADAFGRIGTILGLTGDDYKELADSIVAVGNAGASTESEITEIAKRFAAEAKAAGLAKEEMVGLASATASLGFEPERGGTALARVFANLATNIALANSKGKAFSSVTGRSIKDLQDSLNRGEGLEIFQDFLTGLKDLKPTDAAKVLKAAGITNTSDRTIFRAMAAQLPFVNEQLEIAANATGALSEEAQKRFNTIASKLTLLKNNFIEAGITIGEGFLPALGRVTDKLIAFLKVDANKTALANIGKDLGKALDGINWQEVLAGARTFYGAVKTIFDVINSLPTEIKAAAAAFLVLNKASGGLIGAGAGNIVGGLAGAAARLASRAPGIGRIFAQPVFVTNWAMMAGGGLGAAGAGIPGAAAAGGLSGVAKMFLVGEAIGLALLVNEVRNGIADGVTRQSEAIETQTQAFLRQNPSTTDLKNALLGVEQGILNLERNPLNVLVQGDALTNLKEMRDAIRQQIANQGKGVVGPEKFGPPRPGSPVVGSEVFGPFNPAVLDAIAKRGREAGFKPTSAAVAATNQRNLERLAAANRAAMDRVASEASRTTAAALLTAAAVQNADRKPPITNVNVNVNVTAAQVSKSVTIQRRFGPAGGSRDRPGSGSGPQEF